MFFGKKKLKEIVQKKLEKVELDLEFAENCDLSSTRDRLIAQREILTELLRDIEKL